MNPDTGEIRYLAENEPTPEGFIPITRREAHRLSRTAEKERSAQLKQMRKSAIRRAKKLVQSRLSSAEMAEVLEMV